MALANALIEFLLIILSLSSKSVSLREATLLIQAQDYSDITIVIVYFFFLVNILKSTPDMQAKEFIYCFKLP
jgi:hypothetical protein